MKSRIIFIDRTKLDQKNIGIVGYTGDINEIFILNEMLPDISNGEEPKVYHYNYISKTKENLPLFNMMKTNTLAYTSCPYYDKYLNEETKENKKLVIMDSVLGTDKTWKKDVSKDDTKTSEKLRLYMIWEVSVKWDEASMLELYKKFDFANPKAIMINKYYKVWGNALFFLKKGNEIVDMTRDWFIKNIYNHAVIKGKYEVEFCSPEMSEKYAKEHEIEEFNNTLNDLILTKYNSILSDIGSSKISVYDVKTKILKDDSVCKVFDKLYSDNLVSGGMLDWMVLWKDIKDDGINSTKNKDKLPILSKLYTYSKEYILAKDEYKTKLEMLNKELEIAKQKTKVKYTKEQRREHALRFLKYITTKKHIVTLEDAYVVMSAQLNNQYIEKARPWYQSGAYFHPLSEFQNLMLKIEDGVSIPKTTMKDYDHVSYQSEPSENRIF